MYIYRVSGCRKRLVTSPATLCNQSTSRASTLGCGSVGRLDFRLICFYTESLNLFKSKMFVVKEVRQLNIRHIMSCLFILVGVSKFVIIRVKKKNWFNFFWVLIKK